MNTKRFASQASLAMLAVLVCIVSAAAQNSPPGAGQARTAAPLGQAPLNIPGYWALGFDSVQKEIGLSAQQREKILDLDQRFEASYRQAVMEVQQAPPQEQQQKVAGFQQRIAQQAQAVRKEVDTILSPQQVQAFKDVLFRMQLASVLASPQLADTLGLSEQQREKLRALKQETVDKLLQLLTPEQQARLKEIGKQR